MKNVSEIFGFNSGFTEKNKYRKNFICPYTNDECDRVNKKSNLQDDQGNMLLAHQTGACSCNYKPNHANVFKPVIICPYRFEEKNDENKTIVFKKIKDYFFKNKKIIFKKEIGLKGYGRADFMIGIYDNNKLVDYAHCEFQSDATTGTRGIVQCVKDFYENKSIAKNYNFGLNTKATIKGFSLQMIDKGFLFKKLGKTSIWVMQDHLVDTFEKIYNLDLTEDKTFNPVSSNNIYIVETQLNLKNGQKYKLNVSRILNVSPEQIQKALSKKDPIKNDYILDQINKKMDYEVL